MYSQLIADYLREHHTHLKIWRLSEPELRELSPREIRLVTNPISRGELLVEDRDKLVQQKVRLQNQLRSTLCQYFPQAVKAFSDITTQTALEFLEKFPTFSSTQGMTDYEFTP